MNTAFGVALQLIQSILALALILAIIMQAKGSGLGSLFGGSDAAFGLTKTRRGLENTLFRLTIVLSALFLLTSLIALLIQRIA